MLCLIIGMFWVWISDIFLKSVYSSRNLSQEMAKGAVSQENRRTLSGSHSKIKSDIWDVCMLVMVRMKSKVADFYANFGNFDFLSIFFRLLSWKVRLYMNHTCIICNLVFIFSWDFWDVFEFKNNFKVVKNI